MRYWWILLGALCVGYSPIPAWAASSPDYTLPKETLASGGERETSTAHAQPAGVLGASLGGMMASGSYILNGGYDPAPGDAPIIISLTPNIPAKPYIDQAHTITAIAEDPQRETLAYQFWIDTTLLRDWSPDHTATWVPNVSHLGRRMITVYVRDPDTLQTNRYSTTYVIREPVQP